MGKIITFFSVILIVIGIYFSAQYVLGGDIIFHTDIARDFMLMQDMVASHKLTLIGPKIGPIPGLFHGPLWLYLNLPAFILGHGNPVVVGWGWVIMGVLFLLSTYWTVDRIFGRVPALLATVFLSSRLAFFSHQLFNPSGAIMLAPLFFYTYWKYFQSHEPKYLVYLSLILGCLIQFEVAFGLPITILVFLSIVVSSIRSRKFTHPLYLFAILIPLSTYLIFDLRHNFFQFNSIMNYFKTSNLSVTSLGETFNNRLGYIIDSGYGFITPSNIPWEKFVYSISLLTIIIYGIKSGKKKSSPYYLYLYLFLGYWLLSFLYHGKFEGYYYGPMQILTLIIFTSGASLFPTILSIGLLSPLIFLNFEHSKVAAFSTYDYSGTQASSWLYNLNLAKSIYEDAGTDFGYFALSEDLLAYSPKYALIYAQRFYPNYKSYLSTKKPITYVLISKDTFKQGSIDVRWWEEGQVRIAKEPLSIKDSGYYLVKKYSLSDAEIKIPEDPNLLQGIQFR